jgi:hypothetical protein
LDIDDFSAGRDGVRDVRLADAIQVGLFVIGLSQNEGIIRVGIDDSRADDDRREGHRGGNE